MGDLGDNCGTMACWGGVSGTCSSHNPGGSKVAVMCATRNVRETGVAGINNHGGTCTCDTREPNTTPTPAHHRSHTQG